MRSLLVTGGAGFIGSNFVRYALAQPGTHTVVNLDKLTYAGHPENIADLAEDPRHHFVRGDINDAELVGDLLRRHDVEGIVNFAAESHVDRSIDSPEPFLQTNVLGTFRLLEVATRHHATLAPARAAAFRLLHASTDEVFGSLGPDDESFTETHPLLPHNPYAASKASADHLVRAYFRTYGTPVLSTNCSNNYGPRQFPEKLIPLALRHALNGRPIPIYGDGRQVRDWLYVEDHCTATWQVLTAGRPGESYNIGGDCERSNLALLAELCRILDSVSPRADGKSHRDQLTHVADRPGHDRRYAINHGKISRELAWEPRESLSTGLEKTVRWYLANQAWCDAVMRSGLYHGERLGLSREGSATAQVPFAGERTDR
jgi:dTDP-glucose 4,6-dehydratase